MGSNAMAKPVNSIALSGTLRSFGIIVHCPSRSRGKAPVAMADAYATRAPTTGRSCLVYGSRIVVRANAARVAGSTTATASRNPPASSCSTRMTIMPPWL
jgi:hypothetical protein